MLTDIDIPIENLVLDPNNPRFAKDFKLEAVTTEEHLVASERETIDRFTLDDSASEDATTSTADLCRSMMDIGYVAIDRVVVRKIAGTDKYLVIEGNRRISTVKKLLLKLKNQDWPHEKLEKVSKHQKSFQVIPCKLISADINSCADIQHSIAVILGIRHHGSLLEWEPLPRAYNIYSEYIHLSDGDSSPFTIDNRKITEIASRLSISTTKVRSALQTYIAFLQLSRAVPSVKSKHYSLIEAAVSNRSLRAAYINQSSVTYEIDQESVDRLNTLLQFDIRDSTDYTGKKIVRDPSGVRAFGVLIQKKTEAEHPATREFIQSQIDDVLDLNNETSIDDANDCVTEHLNRVKWVDTINHLLDDRESKLPVEEFTGIGNDLAALHQLRQRLERIKRIL